MFVCVCLVYTRIVYICIHVLSIHVHVYGATEMCHTDAKYMYTSLPTLFPPSPTAALPTHTHPEQIAMQLVMRT